MDKQLKEEAEKYLSVEIPDDGVYLDQDKCDFTTHLMVGFHKEQLKKLDNKFKKWQDALENNNSKQYDVPNAFYRSGAISIITGVRKHLKDLIPNEL